MRAAALPCWPARSGRGLTPTGCWRAGRRHGVPLLEGRGLVDGRAAAYVCERFTCQAPVTSVAALLAALGG